MKKAYDKVDKKLWNVNAHLYNYCKYVYLYMQMDKGWKVIEKLKTLT